MSIGILELGAVMLLAAVLGLVARSLRQPLIVAYIATGAIIAYLGAFSLIDPHTLEIFSQLGIMFLLFLVGLEINYSSLRLVGKASAIIGVGQIIFTSLFGFLITRAFGLAVLPGLYLALALTFSSTIIIIKLLTEKKDLGSLYGKISVGFMLVQDVCAILLLVILAGGNGQGTFSLLGVALVLLKAGLLFTAMLWLGRKIFPQLLDRFANSEELFFLLSTAWVFLIAAFAHRLGFSVEIGGFLAGMSLANSHETLSLSSRIKPLRDFFILIFFVLLGASFASVSLVGIWPIVLAFSLFVLIGNPLIVMIIMGLLGYRRSTSFKAGVTVAQISEFSLILVALGLRLGHIDESIVAVVTGVAVVTILSSVYMISYASVIERKLDRLLRLFERKNAVENKLPDTGYHKPYILLGAHRTGSAIISHMQKDKLLIVDFDPDIVKQYRAKGYDCLLGDIADADIREAANLAEAKLVISTSPDFQDNLGFLRSLNLKGGLRVILRAETEQEAEALYEAGASYVIFPHKSLGHFLGRHIMDHPDLAFLDNLKNNERDLMEKGLVI